MFYKEKLSRKGPHSLEYERMRGDPFGTDRVLTGVNRLDAKIKISLCEMFKTRSQLLRTVKKQNLFTQG